MDIPVTIARLEKQLKEPLPGSAFQMQMSSLKRIRDLMKGMDEEHAVKSSVLLLLYPDDKQESLLFVLIQRPEYDGVHSGQISLPGGRYETIDRNLTETALRESRP